MEQMTPELHAALDVAKQRIKVDSYFPRAMNAGLKGNAQGFWSGTALGFLTGGAAGGLISIALNIVAPGSGLIGVPLILGVAGIGGTVGGATGARIGAGSGAIAGVAAERERRDRAEKLEQEVLASPEKQREVIAAYRKDPVVERNDTLKEIYATSRGSGKAFGKIIHWPTFMAAVAICMAASMTLFGGAFLLGGGVIGAAAMPAIASGLGALGMTSMSSALAIGAGAGAGMGAAFGIAYPPIFAGLTKSVADFLSGNTLRGKSQFGHIRTVREIEAEAVVNREASEGLVPKLHVPAIKIAASESPSTQVSDMVAQARIADAQHQLAV